MEVFVLAVVVLEVVEVLRALNQWWMARHGRGVEWKEKSVEDVAVVEPEPSEVEELAFR